MSDAAKVQCQLLLLDQIISRLFVSYNPTPVVRHLCHLPTIDAQAAAGHKSPAPAVANWVGTAAPQDYRRRPSRHLLHCACAVGEVAAATESLKDGTRLHFRLNYFPPKFAMKN